jgi:16S rRNA (cytosine1402-N4)-methyltransferase
MHTPVLVHEVLALLDPHPGEFFIDGTVNGGGHAAAIVEKIGASGMLLGVDWDGELAGQARARFSNQKNVRIVEGNYANLISILENENLGAADGLLLDLGFSSAHLDNSGKGFTFEKDEPLTMTYNSATQSVREIIKNKTEKELGQIIFTLSQ